MSTTSRLLSVAIALALAACGGDDGSGDDVDLPPTMPARVVLEVPAQLAPGDNLPIAWTVTDAPEGAQVALRLREPGDPVTPSSAGHLYTGSAPANGPRWWIESDGGLVPDQVEVADPAASGEIEIELPSLAEGDWAVDLFLLDADGAPLAMTSARAWIASGPSVRLDLSRTWAEPEDAVHAAVEIRGAELEPLRLSAWLTIPDGTTYSLPELAVGYRPVREGEFPSGRIELLGAEIGRYGEGEYVLSVLLETLDGVRRGDAGAVIQVCSAPGTIEGSAADGDGVAFDDGRILLIDQIDGETFETDVTPAGEFSVEVPAGSFVLFAGGDDWAAGTRVEVGCGAIATVALIGTPSLPGNASAARTRTVRAAAPPPADPPACLSPAPRPKVSFGVNAAVPDTVIAFHSRRYLAHKLRTFMESETSSAFDHWGHDEAAAVMREALTAQLLEQHTNIADGMLGDFFVLLELSANDAYEIRITVTDLRTHSVIAEAQGTVAAVRIPPDQVHSTLEPKVLEMATTLLTENLIQEMVATLARPQNPLLSITLDKTRPAPGESVIATLSVADASPRTVICDRNAILTVTAASSHAEVASTKARTNARGEITMSFTVPATGADPSYYVNGSLPGCTAGRGCEAAGKAFDVTPTGFAGLLTSAKGTLLTGERTEVRINSTGFLGVYFDGVNGQPDTTSGPPGDGLIDFIAGPVQGPATLTGTFINSTNEYRIPLRFYVVSPVVFSAFADPNPTLVNDAYVAIRGVVTKLGVGVPNVAVAFNLAGLGLMASGVKTNADGAYSALYQAPHDGSGKTTIIASVVIDSNQILQTVMLGYGPSCANCPVEILPFTSADAMRPMLRGGTQLFSANQPVNWMVTGDGTINSQGLFTAGQTSGTILIRATSQADSTNFAIARVIVACTTLAEIIGDHTFSGTMNSIVTAVAPYTCSTTGGVDVYGPIDGMLQVDVSAFLTCGPNRYLWGGFPNAQLESCSIGYEPPGGFCDGSGVLGPDPDQPGLTHRRLTAFGREDVAGVCTLKFQGSGILE